MYHAAVFHGFIFGGTEMKKLIAALLFAISAPSFAVGTANGEVNYIFVHSPNVLMFQVGATVSTPPACSTNNQWAVKLDTVVGKNLYALLLSAQAQGRNVQVYGTGLCDVWPDRERPYWARIL